MSVGYFVAASRTRLSNERIDSAFASNTPWGQDGGYRDIDLRGSGWRIVCMGDRSSETTSLWTEQNRPDFLGSFVFVLGWCYRISSSSKSLNSDDYRQIHDRFRAGNPPLDSDFSGNFVAVCYDAQRQRIAVQPDRLAIGTAFYGESEGEIAVSNRALRVANYFGSALDGHSVLSLMRGTHMPFGRTFFAGVRRLMGSTYLDVDLADAHANVRKPYSMYVEKREISYSDSVDLVASTLKTIVRRLLAASPVQFDLTGGNDTRAIASAIENVTRNNGSTNFGFHVTDPEGSADVVVARRVAESCGWPLVRTDRFSAREPSLQEAARSATCGDGNALGNLVWERVNSDQGYHSDVRWKSTVGASAGELFRGYFYAQEMLALGKSSVNYDALLSYREYASRNVDLGIFGSDAPTLEAHDQVLMAPFRAIGDEGGSRPNADKLDLMYMQRHCYRAGHTLSWLMGFANPRVPFCSWELAGLGLSLPWKYRANRKLMQRVIGQLSPKLANIPNEDGEPMKPLTFATLPSYAVAKVPIAASYAGRVIRKLLHKTGGAKVSGLPTPHPTYFSVLDNAKALPDIFDPAGIARARASVASAAMSRDSLIAFYALCNVELLMQEASGLRHQIVFN